MVIPELISGRLGNKMFQLAFIYKMWRDGKIPDIYLQGERFFHPYESDIKKLYGANIGRINKVAIHVRRAANPIDPKEPKYSENPFYVNLCDTDYYQKAMKFFAGEEFVVFSDDIEWCKSQEMFKDCEFVTRGTSDVEDLNKMASCTGHIIANSSFSWWAAYLSPHGGRVVAPKDWYSDGAERTTTPDHWIKV